MTFSDFFEEQEQPSGQPAEVLDRLMRYAREREERMAEYRAAWARRWREADAARAGNFRASLWRVQ